MKVHTRRLQSWRGLDKMVYDVVCNCLDCQVAMTLDKFDEDSEVYYFTCGKCGDKAKLKAVA